MVDFLITNGGDWVVDDRRIIDRRAGRPAGRFVVHSHGRELFPSDTSSDTRAHPIDFIKPDCHLLGKIVSSVGKSFSQQVRRPETRETFYVSRRKKQFCDSRISKVFERPQLSKRATSKYSFFSIFRDLQDVHSFAPLQS